MFLIGILVAYYLFTAVNMIHRFSTTGILPRENSRRRFRMFITLLIIFAAIVLMCYVICVLRFYSLEDPVRLSITNVVFNIIRAVAMMIEAFVMLLMLWKLKRAKVTRTDSGHLNVCNAAILLILQLMMVTTGLFSAFYFDLTTPRGLKICDMSKDVIDFLLGVMYFKMI